jgi:hypothetical protein
MTKGAGSRQLWQRAGVEQELQMPAELAATVAEALELVEADAAAEQHVEAQADDACVFQPGELGVGRVRADHGDAAQPVAVGRQRLDHQPVVGAVHADLDQHAAGHADGVEHTEIGRRRRLGRGVAAAGDQRIAGRPADDMGMGVAGAGRQPDPARRPRRRVRPLAEQRGGQRLSHRHAGSSPWSRAGPAPR